MTQQISGFSKLPKSEKIDWIARTYFADASAATRLLKSYWLPDEDLQRLHDDFIENPVSNFILPLGIAPNFTINGRSYTVPMVIEESSVVAAAAKSAKFWASRGGFKTTVLGTEKIGQVHLRYSGNFGSLQAYFDKIKPELLARTEPLTKNMQARGGGITSIELRDRTDGLPGYYQLHVRFQTVDSMGANFINSCLENIATTFGQNADEFEGFGREFPEIVMSILSNYVPDCVVRAEVSCPVSALADKNIPDPEAFARKFETAVKIAEIEPYRAVTHNKGIMNGVDAVVLATGNDFRAVEAAAHAYAGRNGTYSSLTHCDITDGIFRFWLEIPLALGTVGGLTSLHPMVKFGLQMLENPSARDLMQIVAAAGLAQNFAALRSLTTTGIQEGHMKMHLNNILNQLGASEHERETVRKYFKKHAISHAAVVNFITGLRNA